MATALDCCADAREAAAGVALGHDAAERRAVLAHGVRGAVTGLFQRECGYATYQAAGGFLELARAFARAETPSVLRAELAPAVEASARFLESALTRMTDGAFAAAHANRPEIL